MPLKTNVSNYQVLNINYGLMCFPVQQTTVRDGRGGSELSIIPNPNLALNRTTRHGFEPGHYRVILSVPFTSLSIHTGHCPDMSVS